MEEQFAALGMSVERMPATTPESIRDHDVAPLSKEAACEKLSAVELAISVSHFRAWRRMLESGEPWSLVLEDDVRLSSVLPAFLDALAKQGSRVGALRLETRGSRVLLHSRAEEAPLGVSLHLPLSYEFGAGAYVIAADYARTILASPKRFTMPIDDILFSPRSPLRDTRRIRTAVPALAIFRWHLTRDFEVPPSILVSDVQESRAARQNMTASAGKRNGRQKIFREPRRLARQLPEFHRTAWYWLRSERMIVPFAGDRVSAPPSAAPPHE